MAKEDFQLGETTAHLQNIKNDVTEIKKEMKSHNADDRIEFEKLNDKIDEVKYSAKDVATKLISQEEINEDRHIENQETLKDIKNTVDTIVARQTETNTEITKIKAVAAFIGGGSSLIVPQLVHFIQNYFLHK